MSGSALQDSGEIREKAMELPEGAVRISPLNSFKPEVVPSPTRGGSVLRLTFDLLGCLDALGPVLHAVARRDDGKVDVYFYALNIHMQASMTARCASMPTAAHEIWLGTRKRTLSDVNLKLVQKVPLGAPGEGSLALTETMKALKVTLAEVESASVSMPRCVQGRPCPPPSAAVGLFYSMGCLSSLGPVLYDATVAAGSNPSVKLFLGAVEIIDKRSSGAFCVAPAMARVVAHVEGIDPGSFDSSQIRITNLTSTQSAARPLRPDESGVTVNQPDPDGTFVGCEAYWTGWHLEEGVCHQAGSSGCSNPFQWQSLDECRAAQSIPGPNQRLCRAMFSGFRWNAELKACEAGYATGCTSPFPWSSLDDCLAANSEAKSSLGLRQGVDSDSCAKVFEGWYLNPTKPRRCVGGTFYGCKNPFPWATLSECRTKNGVR
jgi:hypothetical protein